MDMDTWEPVLGAGPLLGIAAAAIALILFLVMRLKLHAFVALIIASIFTALAAGIPIDGVMPTLMKGFSSTLGNIALLVGLGAMIGRLVEASGGAQSLADALVKRFGEDKAPFALGLASLIMGFPIFFDAGLIVMLPVIFAVARRLDGPILAYGIPAAGAFSVMHVFVPPHPGPVAASDFYGADMGLVLLFGLLVALPTWYVSGYHWGKYVGKKYPNRVADTLLSDQQQLTHKAAGPGTVIAVMLIPMLLIFGNTGVNALSTSGRIDGGATWARTLTFLGQTPIALLVTVLVAMVAVGFNLGVPREEVQARMESALGPVCSVILITGAGGMFGGVLRTSGIGDALADSMSNLGIPVLLAAWLIAAALRIAQGSATVALTTAAALMVPAVEAGAYSGVQLALIVLATAAGSVIASHVNDSGFWLVGRLMGLDVATTLKTWTVNQTLIAVIGLLLTSVFYGITLAF
ncbi:High-affinity gluconate transporter [Corynebacterium jeddahense]|uniref:High-affinity gluconate transporter n=2 Tax=Corynebacterium jeddahense TaxID=1414719 RepID=A0ABY7UM81_9CORY|nr:High-affinity gluconate transporter [Corynebacterium jeddahense]